MLDTAADRHRGRTAMRYKRDGAWWTRSYGELRDRARAVAEALWAEGVRPGDRVALFHDNAPEWVETYFGIVALGAAAVPMDPKLREQEVAHILTDAGVALVLCGRQPCRIVRAVEDRAPALRSVFTLDGPPPSPADAARARYAEFSPVRPAGTPAWSRAALTADTPASLLYTSGTTGRAKGALLTHGNFGANAQSCVKAIRVRPDDNFLLVLPLHHSFAFTTNLLVPILAGAEISFVESLKAVGDSLREVSPTILLAVPLLLEKLYRRLEAGVREKRLARWLLAAGLYGPVRRAVRARLGGRLRLMVSGGAPCDPALLLGFARLGLPAIEGYGLTEAGPVVSLNPPEAPRPGTVGRPLPGTEVRLLDADAAGVGELAVRGPNVMAGYFNNPEATRAAILDGGWLATGDLASVDADGYITICGRRKALIVNREGKNIYPEEVEQQIGRSPFVLESLVLAYRDPAEPTGERVGAIIVPNLDAIVLHLGRKPAVPEVEQLVRDDLRRVLNEIAEYKHPRRIRIHFEELEKTSTAKIKRFLYQLD